MKLKEIVQVAESKGLKDVFGMEQQELIRAIQVAEGNQPCYLSEISPVCGIEECLWRKAGCGEQGMTS